MQTDWKNLCLAFLCLNIHFAVLDLCYAFVCEDYVILGLWNLYVKILWYLGLWHLHVKICGVGSLAFVCEDLWCWVSGIVSEDLRNWVCVSI
jgi:hypothetical protein